MERENMQKGIYTFIEKETYDILLEILDNQSTEYSLENFEYSYGNYIGSVHYGDAFIYIEQINDDGVYNTFLNHYYRNEYDREAYIGYPEDYSIRVTPNQFLEALKEIQVN